MTKTRAVYSFNGKETADLHDHTVSSQVSQNLVLLATLSQYKYTDIICSRNLYCCYQSGIGIVDLEPTYMGQDLLIAVVATNLCSQISKPR